MPELWRKLRCFIWMASVASVAVFVLATLSLNWKVVWAALWSGSQMPSWTLMLWPCSKIMRWALLSWDFMIHLEMWWCPCVSEAHLHQKFVIWSGLWSPKLWGGKAWEHNCWSGWMTKLVNVGVRNWNWKWWATTLPRVSMRGTDMFRRRASVKRFVCALWCFAS